MGGGAARGCGSLQILYDTGQLVVVRLTLGDRRLDSPNDELGLSMPSHNLSIASLTASSFLLLTSPGFAACQTSQFQFVFKNESISASQDAAPQGCGIRYQPGPRATFTEASIVSTPAHGSLRKLGAFTFAYYPQRGYHGADSYSIKICGSRAANRMDPGNVGCSTITYAATLK